MCFFLGQCDSVVSPIFFEGWGGGWAIFWDISHFYFGHEAFWWAKLEEEFVFYVKNQNNDRSLKKRFSVRFSPTNPLALGRQSPDVTWPCILYHSHHRRGITFVDVLIIRGQIYSGRYLLVPMQIF